LRVAIDRLPSGRFRARLMIDGRRYTATLPTEADARLWELETRGAVAGYRRAASVSFAAYAEGWLAGFIDDAPDRARYEAALQRRLLPVLGQVPLLEVLETDRDELYRSVLGSRGAGDGGATRECLQLILEDAAEDLRITALAAVTQFPHPRRGHHPVA
jgi:hypothetical protein